MLDVSEWDEDLQKEMNGSRIYIQPFSANIEGNDAMMLKEHAQRRI